MRVGNIKSPAQATDHLSVITAGKIWHGAAPLHPLDCAIPLVCQDHMIATVDAAIDGKTIIHTLQSSHSPFLSQPPAPAKILVGISG
jgi:hypothetical protein